MKPDSAEAAGLTVLSRRWVLFPAGWFLSLAAGLVNGVTAVAIVFEPTTHLSGRVNFLLHDLAFDFPEGLLVASIVYCFVAGGAVAGWLAPRLGCARTLLVAAVPLALGTLLVWTGGASCLKDAYTEFTALHYGVAAMLAFAAGLQNGATSQNKIGRTTHVTGDLTDMGLAIAQADWRRAAFLFTKHAGFAIGGVAGFVGVNYFAPASMLLAGVKAIVLAALTLLILDYLLVPRPAPTDPLEAAGAG
jgi:MFS family permease